MTLLKHMKRKVPLLVTLVYAAAVGFGLMVLLHESPPPSFETAAAVSDDAALQKERAIDLERRGFRAALLLLPWFAVLNPGSILMLVLTIVLNVASVYAIALCLVGPSLRIAEVT